MSHRTPDQVRAALFASESLTEAILRSATEFAIIAMDLNGNLTTWNTGAEEILGWPDVEALGRPAEMIFTPEDREKGVPAQEMALASRDGQAADERWHMRRDGTRFFASGSMMPLRGADGAEHGYLKILRDRTKARSAEESRDASARIHEALIATQRGVAAAGGDLDAVMNAVAAGALGITAKADGAVVEMRDGEEIVYRAAAGVSRAHVGLRLQVDGSFSGLCLKTGRPLLCHDAESDGRVDRAACRKVGVASMLAVPVPHRGEFVGVLKLHAAERDAITEADVPVAQLLVGVLAAGLSSVGEVEAVNALRASEVQLRIAQEAGGVGTFVWDLGSDTVTGTETFRTVLGLPEGVISAGSLSDAIHPEDRPRASAAASRAFDANTLAYREFRVIRPDTGEVRWIARRGEMIRNEEGRFAQGIGVVYDVTERKQTEETLHRLNEALEGRVEERTQALVTAEEQLRQSQKMEALGQLTSGIAHDFNNMLAGVVGSLDMIQTRLGQGRMTDLARYVSAALTSANRAAAMTHRLLAFARRQPLDPQPVDANRLVTSMEDLLRRMSGPAVDLKVALSPVLWRTACDVNQLENALLNLAINARDAMPDGGRLTVETSNAILDAAYAERQPEVKPGRYVCLAVTDMGKGMPPDVVARAFDPFFTTKPLGQGTGLGLSMIYNFVKQSAGHVRIYSEVGIGTTVKLYLPRLVGEGDADETGDVPGGAGAETRKTVLIVEDEEIIRMLVSEIVDELGHHAVEAGDGKSAFACLEAGERIDLLLTDLGLPGVNGRQVAERARELHPDVKVLFITGYAENAAQNDLLAPGSDVMSKPFAMDALREKLRAILA